MALCHLACSLRTEYISATSSSSGSKATQTASSPILPANLSIPGETDELNLPDLWTNLAATGGKREQKAIVADFREVAEGLVYSTLVPVVTPDLTKKITSVRFAGRNMDDLADRISPGGEVAYLEALPAAQDYDDLITGGTAANMDDIKNLNVVPTAPGRRSKGLPSGFFRKYSIASPKSSNLMEGHDLQAHMPSGETSCQGVENCLARYWLMLELAC